MTAVYKGRDQTKVPAFIYIYIEEKERGIPHFLINKTL